MIASFRIDTHSAIKNQYGSIMRTIRKDIVPNECAISAIVVANIPIARPRAIQLCVHRYASRDVPFGATLGDFIEYGGYDIERCHDAPGVFRLVSRRDFDILVLDLTLKSGNSPNADTDVTPIDLVSFVRQQNPHAYIILLFDPTDFDKALEGIRQGAFFYLPKSVTPSDVALIIEKAARNHHAQAVATDSLDAALEDFIGHSPAMQRVIDVIRKVAPTDSAVLLLGESGTGKELLANAVHRASRRSDMPFVAVNCAALPESLLESELFGHVKGAFTGADNNKRGLFEEADGGTLFLDEIGEMPPILQAKMLRVLQNGEVRPVGSSTSHLVDVRILAATNRDLTQAVQEHTFREDLYYRLNVVQIRVPALRERRDALPALVRHFLQRASTKFSKPIRDINPHAYSLLAHYEFPGNVRELENIIDHAVIMAEGNTLQAQDLPDVVRLGSSPRLGLEYDVGATIKTLAQLEEEHIRRVLHDLEGNQTKAAKKLGISRSTLWRKMREYGLERTPTEKAE
jgi:DNA-binding NtrC family response regulator